MSVTFELLKKVSSEKELKDLAPLTEIINTLEEEIAPLSIRAATYEELFKAILALKHHWNTFQKDVYFQSESARYIYALTHMEGKKRNEIIELTDDLYDDESKAKLWYKSIVKIIHPDKNQTNQADAEAAMKNLSEIYDRIKSCFNNEED